MVKGASIYSNPWRTEKYTPRITVVTRPWMACLKLFSIRLWCAQVTVNPDESKIKVFNKGIWRGLNGLIPLGGQFIPSSIDGDNLEWKNLQKKEIKKNTSDVINRIIPHRSPIVTI